MVEIDSTGLTTISIVVMSDGKPVKLEGENGSYNLGWDKSVSSEIYKIGTSEDFLATNYIYKHIEPYQPVEEEPAETYELITSLSSISPEDTYIIFNKEYESGLFDYTPFSFNSATYELKGLASFNGDLLYIEKYTINNADYYAIYTFFDTKRYLGCDAFNLEIKYCDGAYLYQVEMASDGRIYFSPVELDATGTPTQVMVNGQALYLGFNDHFVGFVPTKESTNSYYVTNYLYKVVAPTEE